jgi:predicted nucleic acid-binding protein
VILVDTSAWIEFLRGTGSPAALRVEALLAEDTTLATTDVVVMEVLAGARDDLHEARLRRLLRRCQHLSVEAPDDFLAAARLYRQCRAGGDTVRKLVDCLIAAVALRSGVRVLHFDRDFEALERHTGVQIDRD